MYREVSVIEIREVLRAWLSGSDPDGDGIAWESYDDSE